MMHKNFNNSLSAPSSPGAVRGYGRSDDFLGLSSTHRSWKPKDSKATPSSKKLFGNLLRNPPLCTKTIDDSLLNASQHSTTSCTSTSSFSNSSHHHVQEVVRMLDKDCNVLPPAFHCLGKHGPCSELPEDPKRVVSRSSAPSRLAVDAILSKMNLPRPTPKRLQVQWPPTAPIHVSRHMEVGRLPPCHPVRNASIRIRWVGSTFTEDDGVEGYFQGCPNKKQLSSYLDENTRPNVWVTPCQGSVSSVSKKPWRVKRVWNVEQVDEHEEEHIVSDGLLVEKVKELLGVASEEGSEEYDPSDTHWRFNKVYDLSGEVQQQSRSQKVDEEGLLVGIEKVAELHAKWTFEEGGENDFYDDGEWDAQVYVEQPPKSQIEKKGDPLGRRTVHSRAPAPPSEEMTTPMRRKAKSFTSKEQLLKEEKKQKKQMLDDNEPESIFDLLAPPPVIFFGGY